MNNPTPTPAPAPDPEVQRARTVRLVRDLAHAASDPDAVVDVLLAHGQRYPSAVALELAVQSLQYLFAECIASPVDDDLDQPVAVDIN